MSKGSKNRTVDRDAYRNHFSKIKFPHYCKRCGIKVCKDEDFCPQCKKMVENG